MTDLKMQKASPLMLFNKWLRPETRKEPTEFVKRMRELTARAKQRRVLWDSSNLGTYVRTMHGELK